MAATGQPGVCGRGRNTGNKCAARQTGRQSQTSVKTSHTAISDSDINNLERCMLKFETNWSPTVRSKLTLVKQSRERFGVTRNCFIKKCDEIVKFGDFTPESMNKLIIIIDKLKSMKDLTSGTLEAFKGAVSEQEIKAAIEKIWMNNENLMADLISKHSDMVEMAEKPLSKDPKKVGIYPEEKDETHFGLEESKTKVGKDVVDEGPHKDIDGVSADDEANARDPVVGDGPHIFSHQRDEESGKLRREKKTSNPEKEATEEIHKFREEIKDKELFDKGVFRLQ